MADVGATLFPSGFFAFAPALGLQSSDLTTQPRAELARRAQAAVQPARQIIIQKGQLGRLEKLRGGLGDHVQTPAIDLAVEVAWPETGQVRAHQRVLV